MTEMKIPDGAQLYTILGLNIVAQKGLPDEMLALIAEGMVHSGHVIFDPETNQLVANPNIEDGKIQGLSVTTTGSGEILSASALPDEEIKKDLGLKDLHVKDGIIPDLKSMRVRKKK